KPGPVRDFFEGVRLFDIPIVVVGHSSEKTGPNGGKSDNPMGNSAIKAAVRWRCFVKRTRDDLTLKFAGNSGKPHEVKVRQGDGAVFEVMEEKDTATVFKLQESRKQDRDA